MNPPRINQKYNYYYLNLYRLITSVGLFVISMLAIGYGYDSYAQSCTGAISHSFYFTIYYLGSSSHADTAISGGEEDTIGPGADTANKVTCCVDFVKDGHEHVTVFLHNLTTIDDLDEELQALDEAELNNVNADHGVFIEWNYEFGGLVLLDDSSQYFSCCTQADCDPFGIDCTFCNPDVPDNCDPYPLALNALLMEAGQFNPDNSTPGRILAHEHGHLHGLEHTEQPGLSPHLPLDDFNVMQVSEEENVGLEDWQCRAEQWVMSEDDPWANDPIGTVN